MPSELTDLYLLLCKIELVGLQVSHTMSSELIDLYLLLCKIAGRFTSVPHNA